MVKPNPPQIMAASFLCVIMLGAALLSLPAATSLPGSLSFIDGLFTSTSAVCVTGLTVVDTGTIFSSAGRWILFALFQIGGLGIMTFSTFFAVLMGRKIGFSETDVIKSSMDRHSVFGMERLILYILGLTFTIEAVGAALLFLRWRATMSWTAAETLTQAVFHSVSGFCNAGFSLFGDSFSAYRADPWINIIMMGLIVAGGIGFIVLMDAAGLFRKSRGTKNLSLQSKVAITTSAILILGGAALIFLFERGNLLKGMGMGESLLASFFQSVTARTAGFNTVNIAGMASPARLVLIFLMFIGASPGSTGGGIKTCTFAVLAVTVYGIMRNKARTSFFGRSVPMQIIREVIVIIFLAIAWIFAATIALTYLERNNPAISGNFMGAFFEVVSAFGTVGLSTGVTAGLSFGGKICIILTMYAGRIGPLTLALAVAFRPRADRYSYPEENIMVG
ncbi:MAG: TrkH family potassium uptake protein [Candidatus Omnitrophota bacterium]